MRTSKAVTTQSRQRILEAAARRLRKHGYDGTSIADLMQEAGMTHGGFYKHFASKGELADLAARAAFEDIAARFDERRRAHGAAAARKAYAEEYLSAAHIAHPEAGCPMAAFGTDAGRSPEALAAAFAEGAETLIARMVGGKASQRSDAIKRLVAMVGAVVVARAVGEGPLRDEILSACRSSR